MDTPDNARAEPWLRTLSSGSAALTAAALIALASPSVPLRDGAELTAAAASLGIAHPTGFVLEMLCFRSAMLLPVGDLALRANVINALMGALAIALLSACIRTRARDGTQSPWLLAALSLSAPALLLRSRTVLRALTATEVYASSLAIAMAVLWLTRPSDERTNPPHANTRWRAIAMLAGLSFLTHTSVRSVIVASAISLAISKSTRPTLSLRRVFTWALCAGLTLALVSYLPFAAHKLPWADWGSPTTLRGVYRHLSAARIREAFHSQMGASGQLMRDASVAWALVREDLGLATLSLAIVGVARSLAVRSSLSIAVLLALVLDLAYSVLVNPMGARDRQTLFVAEAMTVWLACDGMLAIASVLPEKARSIAPLSAGLFAALALAQWPLRDSGRREGWTATELYGGGGALGEAPPRAVVLCESDELCGGSLYARLCEGERPDVVVLPRQHLWDRGVWRRLDVALGRAVPDRRSSDFANESLRQSRLRAIVRTFDTRIRWEQGERSDERIANVTLSVAESPLLAATHAIESPFVHADATQMWVNQRVSLGSLSQRLAASAMFGAGMSAANASLADARPFFEGALRHDETHAPSHTNLAVIDAREGQLSRAIARTERALAIDPSREQAWNNLADFVSQRDGPRARQPIVRRAQSAGVNISRD